MWLALGQVAVAARTSSRAAIVTWEINMARMLFLLLALLMAVGLPTRSQPNGSPPPGSSPNATALNVTDAQATIPELTYRSPFAAYQADKTEKPRSWRDVNDRVGSIGGWRVYAREAQPATSTPSAPVEQSSTAPRK
jgi:hypothetical protein